MKKTSMDLSNVEELITDSGLYRKVSITGENYNKVIELVHFEKLLGFTALNVERILFLKEVKKQNLD